MNSLRQILEFVGLSGVKKFVPSFYGPLPKPTMRWVGNFAPVLNIIQRTSMRAMIPALQNLPSFDLAAEANETEGEEPFTPEIHVHATNGAIIETVLAISQNGRLIEFIPGDTLGYAKNLGANDGIFSTGIGPGSYVFEVKRTGIQNTGITTLSKTFNMVTRAHPAPPPPQPPDPTPPSISVQSKGDGSFVVTGTGFLPNATVHILVGDGTFRNPLPFADTSNSEGKLLGFPTGKICQGPGQLFFEANDGRIKPSNHSTLFSNTVTVSCPA
jgi:hypothetical protein